MRLIIQFIGQAVGVILLRRRWGTERLPFKMWLYPLPSGAHDDGLGMAFLADRTGAQVGLMEIALGVTAYMVWARLKNYWPFQAPGGIARAKNGDAVEFIEEGA